MFEKGVRQARQEHIVPRVLLENFSNSHGRIWVYARTKSPRISRPFRECKERDFYEFELPHHQTSNEYEDWLGRIESDIKPLFPTLFDNQKLDLQQARTVAYFVASLFGRTRKIRTQLSNAMIPKFREQTEDPAFIRDLQYELLKRGELVFAEDLRLQVQQTRTAMESSDSFYHVAGLPHRTHVIAQELLKKTWRTLQAPEGKFFVTSDCPVLTAQLVDGEVRPGSGFAKEATNVLLPISPKYLFVASSPQQGWKPVIEPRGVDSVNRLTARFAHHNVYAPCDSSEIQWFVDEEINSVIFGENAFLPS